ncbi:hypothetical protein CR513_29164, partial [Mucuna pruriens]
MFQEYIGNTSFNVIDLTLFDPIKRVLAQVSRPAQIDSAVQQPNKERPIALSTLNSFQEGEDDAYMKGHGHISHEGFKEVETLAIEGLMTRKTPSVEC